MFPMESDSIHTAIPRGKETSNGSHAAALLRLLDRTEEELSRFAREFEGLADLCQQAMKEREAARAMLGELEQSRREWANQREQEARDLEEERQALITAWTQLESEQRELAIRQQTLRLAGGDGHQSSPQPGSPGPMHPQPRREPVPGEYRPSAAAAEAAEMDAACFEQLRREIRNHSRVRR